MNRFLIPILAALAISACTAPKPKNQDGSDLWLAAGRPYQEVLSSVETAVNPALPAEGYHIYDKDGVRHIDAGSEAGLRYGVYALQRAEVLGEARPGMDLQEAPAYDLRLLNHWDNLDDSVERGYAGGSMWEWTSPSIPEARIRRYGELCASVGLNGAVLKNDVQAGSPVSMDDVDLSGLAVIQQAFEFRPAVDGCSGDEVVGVDTGEFPLRVALDELVVVADLCGQGMHHPVAFHRYTSVGGDLLSGRQDRPRDLDFLYSFHGFSPPFPVPLITLFGTHSK